MPVITEIEDLKRIYRRRVPKMFYDYCESGSWSEQTFRENVSDFDKLYFRQRVARDMAGRNTRTQMLGENVAMPVGLAPVGLTGMQHADGEIHAARAAEKFGVPFCLSTLSICSIEDVAAHTSKPFYMQVYTLTDDDFMQRLFDRAKAAGCSAAVVTVDLQIMGQRHKDIKNGMSAPPKLTPKSVANLATKVGWGLGMLQTKRRAFGNVIGHAKGVTDPSSLTTWTAEAFDQSLDWDRIRQFRKMWDGKLIIKGIMDPRDALEAVNVGADAIVVSNHGGRQLDGTISSIRALEKVVDAVGDKIEVHLDSGIRSGQDVLRAVAMGAKSTWIGRAFVYGLGAMGEKGVTRALEVIQKEMETTMGLCGVTDVKDVDRDILMVPKGFSGDWAE
ncbi:alpha-hydroxy acid oxidase [Allosediminivita pacifica]|uniref:L-lactate dehydrogenase (Cytochrome) n=1 Tax=Allosediminivita pacifica TaxID=1267769 RepID=A0A2T6B0Q1_9RHOB|nr:alpha-hydroxy acid oxidase [Allosediminivita pacifica]PTX49630.1 L-lactate dehydrogenase (cytochrome) [Allosediminivita pacifica]GGB03382.1 alpha-hydroxy-acid oxidizing enzyme [Allosediminivita pacifica]